MRQLKQRQNRCAVHASQAGRIELCPFVAGMFRDSVAPAAGQSGVGNGDLLSFVLTNASSFCSARQNVIKKELGKGASDVEALMAALDVVLSCLHRCLPC